MIRKLDHEIVIEERPQRFLEAWKNGIRLVGEHYFKIKGTLDSASNKWDLEPDKTAIEHSIYKISSGQATLLAVMYSFYNSQDGQLF
jgi:hypothetical protein